MPIVREEHSLPSKILRYSISMSRVFLLGVPLDAVTRQEAVHRLLQYVTEAVQRHVMTPNSEMLVEATRNPSFHAVLQRSSLNLPDSQGVVWFGHLPERVTGVDTIIELCAQLTEEHPIFLLGAGEGIAERAAEMLQQRNPHLRIVGTFAGSPREEDASGIIERINVAQPHLLLVAYGAPQQDLWIAKYLPQLPSVRVAMGVGGTFDFLAGKAKRAPRIFQILGLEWLWRLFLEPKRWKRIFSAVVVFPFLVVRNRRF